MGLGSGSSGGLVTTRGTANLLTRVTAILASLFMVLSLALAYLAKREARSAQLVTQEIKAQESAEKATGKPAIKPQEKKKQGPSA